MNGPTLRINIDALHEAGIEIANDASTLYDGYATYYTPGLPAQGFSYGGSVSNVQMLFNRLNNQFPDQLQSAFGQFIQNILQGYTDTILHDRWLMGQELQNQVANGSTVTEKQNIASFASNALFGVQPPITGSAPIKLSQQDIAASITRIKTDAQSAPGGHK